MKLLGLTLNFIGSLLLAYSVFETGIKAVSSKTGDFAYLTALNPRFFLLGAILLALGFIIQLIGECKK